MSGWRFAFATAAMLTLAGFALDSALGGRGFPAPAWPDNAILLIVFLFLQLAAWLLLRRSRVFEEMAGGKLAVVALGLVCIWAILLGTFPQVVRGVEAPIHQRVMQAPPFIFALTLLLTNLGWGILKHLAEGLSGRSLFLFNHIGVYVLGLSALFGSGDVVRLDIWVKEGDLAWTGSDGQNTYEMPFAIHLESFQRDFFPAQVTVIDGETGEILLPAGTDLLTLRAGETSSFFGYEVTVKQATMEAPWSVPGDPIPAAWLQVTSAQGVSGEGWVSCGSALMPPVFVAVGNVAFAMPEPRSRSYESRFRLLLPNEEEPSPPQTLRVNQPVKVAGWWLYQKGYSLEGGPTSRFSQIEAVRDPWLPVVYAGIALMSVGAILALGRASSLLRAIKRDIPLSQ